MQQVSAEELRRKIADKVEFLLLDVREKYERDAFNIGGVLIPLGEIVSNAAKIPKDIPVIIYCEKGIRSQIAIQRLESRFGFSNLYNLQGGMQKWKAG